MRLGPEAFRRDSGLRMFFHPDTDPDPKKEEEQKTDPPKTEDDPPELGEKGKAAIAAVRSERDAEKARAAAAEEERDALRAKLDEAEEKKRLEAEQAAEKAGEFEKLAQQRKEALDAANEKIKTLETANKRMSEAIDKTIEEEWKGLPKEVTDLFAGGDDPIVKMEWLPKARAHSESLKEKQSERKPGHRQDPDPNRTTPTLEDEVEALRQRSGSISPW